MPLDPLGVVGIVDDGCDRGAELRRGNVRILSAAHACLGLDDLTQGPEGDSLPVRRRSPLAPANQLGSSIEGAEELAHEPALPDSRNADEGESLDRTGSLRAFEGLHEHRQLAPAVDERSGIAKTAGFSDARAPT